MKETKKVNISKAIFKFQSYKYIPSTFDKFSHEIPIIIIIRGTQRAYSSKPLNIALLNVF